MKPTVEIATATPELIKELRALDTHNRKRKKSHVEYIRREIRNGTFTLTNQGVGVSVGGFIVDGGHRLEAIDLEGSPPVQFILVRNLPDDAQKYVDLHAKRSMSDILSLVFNQHISSSIVAMLNVSLKHKNNAWNAKFSPSEIAAYFEATQEEVQRLFNASRDVITLSSPVMAGLLDALCETNDDRILEFVGQVVNGEMLVATDPAMVLRRYLSGATKGSGGSCIQRERYLKTRYAIDAFLKEQPLAKLYAIDSYRSAA